MKRYEPDFAFNVDNGYNGMYEKENGKFVKYDDVKPLIERISIVTRAYDMMTLAYTQLSESAECREDEDCDHCASSAIHDKATDIYTEGLLDKALSQVGDTNG